MHELQSIVRRPCGGGGPGAPRAVELVAGAGVGHVERLEGWLLGAIW